MWQSRPPPPAAKARKTAHDENPLPLLLHLTLVLSLFPSSPTHLGLLHQLLQSLSAVALTQRRGTDLCIDAGRQHRAELVERRLELLDGAQK